ncbi:aminotransferase class I/II-fold pyridoxal phosphate-dependent enzyme [Dyadobacter flavalbus]|uniref:Aminotransferase class I/II-fold pyridoxal phosphate-dependent enzyme n=1 Tax=Dyadobacter flavalbus TaxID=2579942 RepID=A0A5M8R4L2_9BACT|nr:aminotransferase class I/II-fold pyridoxal phosphate-dependent enzyme [Dyadobacter flavalbus]KAA6441743.1 aminotransferase class I/II-fold pyridoxal phosphate-dependent enzyme [Dyadobacter flavalbus]
MKPRIYLSSPHMGGKEMEYIQEAFDSNWIAPAGSNVNGFEQDLCEFTGSRYALALSSGTAAIHLALIVLGVQKDDIVLCQSLTFAASANPVVYLGAVPVFIDSEPVTWNMCPDALETAIKHYLQIGKKPKAVILVHLYGMPALLKEIILICARYDIAMIEDAAEALGATYFNQKLGTFGSLAILSFNGNKIITTSGGGALLCQRQDYFTKARFLASQAKDDAPHYEHSEVGYNYGLSNVLAGIGRGQMKVLPDRIQKRRSNFDFYKINLAQLPGITFQEEPKGFFSNRWLTVILFDPKVSPVRPENAREFLLQKNIETRPLWKPMHLQPLFRQAPYFGRKTAENLFMTGLCLPSGSGLPEEDLLCITNHIRSVFSKT